MRPDIVQAFDNALRLRQGARFHEQQQEGLRLQDERIRDREKMVAEQRLDAVDVAAIAVLVGISPTDVARLGKRLELHHQAVIEALQENRERLDASEKRLEEMLRDAHVLPDGRRVFKTEDGVRVFDEHGQEVSSEEIDASEIEDWRPSYETYNGERETHYSLEEEQRALIEYQERLDDAQDLVERGTLSEDEFADIESLLEDNVPSAVRSRLPADEPAAMAAPDIADATPDGEIASFGGPVFSSGMKLQ